MEAPMRPICLLAAGFLAAAAFSCANTLPLPLRVSALIVDGRTGLQVCPVDVKVWVGADAGTWEEQVPAFVCSAHQDGGLAWTQENPEVILSPQGCGNVVLLVTAPGYRNTSVDAGWLSCDSSASTLFTTVGMDPL
jgi:hypothetical protein